MADRTYAFLDEPAVVGVLFHPRREYAPLRLGANVHAVRLPVDEDIHVGGRIYAASKSAPVIVYFHGNGEIAADYDTLAPLYTDLGITLFVIDYREYGTSDGSASGSALVRDAWTSYQQVPQVMRDCGLEPGPIYVMGRSLGSAAALEIADRAGDTIAGLIIESGFAYTLTLIERIGAVRIGAADEARDGFGNLEKMSRVRVPTLIIHGERDMIIPIDDGLALLEACPVQHKTMVAIPGAGHNDLMLIGHREYFGAIAALCAVGAGTR